MLIRSVQEADGNFSELLAEVERGGTVVLTKDDRPIAEVRPVVEARPLADDRTKDPVWQAAYERMCAMLAAKPRTGYRVGRITEEDKYGPSRW